MVPVFFIGKKDNKKHIVQNYKYFNEWTVKNNYPLSLILDIIEKIGTKKVSTKIDLRWEYNNIWIKKEDEWKVAFTTLEGSFELTVMFFRLTNLLAIFQTIMNKILWNLINARKMVRFIDDVLVRTEMEKGHNEIVEKLIKRLVENNLYIKLEKYKQKVRSIFLGSGNRTRENKDGRREGGRYFCSNSQTIVQYSKKELEVGVNKKNKRKHLKS